MAKKIQIPSWKQGGTLSEIAQKYGTSVEALMQLNPTITNPNKIIAGNELVVPDMTGTLNKETTATGGEKPYTQAPTEEKVLPDTGSGDKLSRFRSLLQKVMEKNANARKGETMNKFQDMGFDPNKVGGGTMSEVLNYVKDYSTPSFEDNYQATLDTVSEMQERSQKNIQELIDSGGIAKLSDELIAKLANAAEIDQDLLLGIRDAKLAEANAPVSWNVVTKNGQKIRQGYDANGNIVKEVATGADITKSESETKKDISSLSPEMQAQIKIKQAKIDNDDLDFIQEITTYPYLAPYLNAPS